MPYKKKMTRKRAMRKRAPVSKTIKNYVKKALTKDKELFIIEDQAVESTAGSLSIWFMDNMMYRGARLQAIAGSQDDHIQSVGLAIKYFIHNNNTANFSTLIRLLVIETQCGSDIDYRTGINLFEWNRYDMSGGNRSYNGTTLDLTTRVNPDKYRVLYDKIVKVGPVGSNTTPQAGMSDTYGRIWIPYRKMIRYDENVAQYPNKGHLAFLALPIEAPNDATTGVNCEITAIGSWYIRH